MPVDRFPFHVDDLLEINILMPTKEQKLATAFLRNQKLKRGGEVIAIRKEYMVISVMPADRTERFRPIFWAYHAMLPVSWIIKYEAITQKGQYFNFSVLFNTVIERGYDSEMSGNSGPQVC